MKVIYEPHPVTPERKAKLLADGYKIIDDKFKPADLVEDKPKPKAKAKPISKKVDK